MDSDPMKLTINSMDREQIFDLFYQPNSFRVQALITDNVSNNEHNEVNNEYNSNSLKSSINKNIPKSSTILTNISSSQYSMSMKSEFNTNIITSTQSRHIKPTSFNAENILDTTNSYQIETNLSKYKYYNCINNKEIRCKYKIYCKYGLDCKYRHNIYEITQFLEWKNKMKIALPRIRFIQQKNKI